jgi:hypothetical protein
MSSFNSCHRHPSQIYCFLPVAAHDIDIVAIAKTATINGNVVAKVSHYVFANRN